MESKENPSTTLTVGHYLFIYKRRKEGWESGLLKYPEPLFTMVKNLVENLEKLNPDTPCRVSGNVENGKGLTLFFANEILIGSLDMSAGRE